MIKEGFDKLFCLKKGVKPKTPFWGESMVDNGYRWSPFITISLDPVTTSNSWREIVVGRSIMTRYANRIIDNSYYGSLTINPCNEIVLGGEDMYHNTSLTFTMGRWVEKDSLEITKHLKKFDF